MATDSFLIAGLENGQFLGWNLANNGQDMLSAHQNAVTCLKKHGGFLISGDSFGNVHVRDTQQY